MSSIVISGDTSGSITVAAPAVAGTNTITFPAATGTVMVSGNMPAFSAYNSSTQSISNGTWTKLVCNTERFDTANCFDSTTNYRFTPNIAGYYQINLGAYAYPSVTGTVNLALYKNGASYETISLANTNAGPGLCIASLIYFNGSSDYIEGYIYQSSGGSLLGASTDFSGCLVRVA